jgi:type IV secretory pathway component VirB8
MSGQDVQRDYQQWFLTAEDSPNKKLLKKGQISVREISMSPVRDGVFLVRFWKITQMYGEKEQKVSATATVEYELLHQAPASLILDDPAAIRIVRYQVEENSAQ